MKRLASLLTALTLVATVSQAKADYQIIPHAGFGFRLSQPSSALEKEVDQSAREVYEPSMPGFSKWMQLSNMIPYISTGLSFTHDNFNSDFANLELLGEFKFSTSKIFGDYQIEKDFDATVMETFHLGSTPTKFTQHLDFYGDWSVGFRYHIPVAGKHTGPFFQLNLGLTYLASKSELHIHVDGTEKALDMIESIGGWDAVNEIDLYQDINTTAEITGHGFSVAPQLGFRVGITKEFGLNLTVGYHYENLWLRMEKVTVSDGKVEKSLAQLTSTSHSLDLQLNLEGYF